MEARTHLLDLMELPSQQRRVIQLLLRNGAMLESDLRRAIRLLPDGEQLTPADTDMMLETLERKGWLTRDLQGDEPRYRVHFSRGSAGRNNAIWERLNVETISTQWRLPALRPAPPQPQQRASALLDSLMEDQPAPADNLLLRRGGKRALPQSIWDKLDDTADDE